MTDEIGCICVSCIINKMPNYHPLCTLDFQVTIMKKCGLCIVFYEDGFQEPVPSEISEMKIQSIVMFFLTRGLYRCNMSQIDNSSGAETKLFWPN